MRRLLMVPRTKNVLQRQALVRMETQILCAVPRILSRGPRVAVRGQRRRRPGAAALPEREAPSFLQQSTTNVARLSVHPLGPRPLPRDCTAAFKVLAGRDKLGNPLEN